MDHLDGQDTQDHDRGPAWRRAWRKHDGSPRMRAVVVATGLLAVVLAPAGIAATGDALKEGVRNGTAVRETQIISQAPSSGGTTGGYATRQSNLSATGGGAVYGCRTGAGGSAANPPQNPCIRSNNLDRGFAFEFNASNGDAAGLITVGGGGDTKKPFTTNATGVATGLNADRVDGQNAADIVKSAADASKERWALINEKGQIEEQSGGFTVASFGANANVYVNAGGSLVGKGLQATIALQNRVDVDGNGTDTAGEDNFSGQAAVARCNTPAVACAPEGTNNDDTLVVRATNADGSATTATTRKRFYVTVTG